MIIGSFSFVLVPRTPPRPWKENPWLLVMNESEWSCLMQDGPRWIMVHDARWCMITDAPLWFMIITDAWFMIMNDAWSSMMHHEAWFTGVSFDVWGGWGEKSNRQNCARHVGKQNGHENGPRERYECAKHHIALKILRRCHSWRREVPKTLILYRNGKFPGRLFLSCFLITFRIKKQIK